MMNGYGFWAARLATGLGLVCAVATAACAPQVELGVQTTTSGGQPGTGGYGGAGGGGSGTGGTFGVGGYAPVSCSTPAGTIEMLPNVADAAAVLQGDWRLCPSTPGFGVVPADTVGIRFAAASAVPDGADQLVTGLAYALVQGATGPEPGAGFAYQLTYDVEGGPTVSGYSMELDILGPSGGNGGLFQFSPSPREVQFALDVAPGQVLLVSM